MHVSFMHYLVLKHSHVLIKLKKIAKIASQNRIAIARKKSQSQKNRIAKFEKNRIAKKSHHSFFEKIASQNFLRCDAIGSPAVQKMFFFNQKCN